MKNHALLFALFILLLTGCTNSPKPKDYKPTVASYSVQMAAYSFASDINDFYPAWITGAIAPVKDQCKTLKIASDGSAEGDKVSPLLIPLIATVAKQLYVSYVNNAQQELETLKKLSTKSYSHTIFTNTNDLKHIDCLVIRRTSKDAQSNEETGLLAVLKLSSASDDGTGFYIEPIFVTARNAVVPTDRVNPTLNVSFAISLKTIAPNDSGVEVVSEFGSAAMTVSSLKPDISIVKCNNINDRCTPSGLLPHQPNKKPVSLSIAVSEQGNLGVDFDARMAELSALKEAYGAAIYSGVEAVLE